MRVCQVLLRRFVAWLRPLFPLPCRRKGIDAAQTARPPPHRPGNTVTEASQPRHPPRVRSDDTSQSSLTLPSTAECNLLSEACMLSLALQSPLCAVEPLGLSDHGFVKSPGGVRSPHAVPPALPPTHRDRTAASGDGACMLLLPSEPFTSHVIWGVMESPLARKSTPIFCLTFSFFPLPPSHRLSLSMPPPPLVLSACVSSLPPGKSSAAPSSRLFTPAVNPRTTHGVPQSNPHDDSILPEDLDRDYAVRFLRIPRSHAISLARAHGEGRIGGLGYMGAWYSTHLSLSLMLKSIRCRGPA